MGAIRSSKRVVMATVILAGLTVAGSASGNTFLTNPSLPPDSPTTSSQPADWAATYPAVGNCTPTNWTGVSVDGMGFYYNYIGSTGVVGLLCSVKRTTDYNLQDVKKVQAYFRGGNGNAWVRLYFRRLLTGSYYAGDKNYSDSDPLSTANTYPPSANWPSASEHYAAYIRVHLPDSSGFVGYNLFRK